MAGSGCRGRHIAQVPHEGGHGVAAAGHRVGGEGIQKAGLLNVVYGGLVPWLEASMG